MRDIKFHKLDLIPVVKQEGDSNQKISPKIEPESEVRGRLRVRKDSASSTPKTARRGKMIGEKKKRDDDKKDSSDDNEDEDEDDVKSKRFKKKCDDVSYDVSLREPFPFFLSSLRFIFYFLNYSLTATQT